MKELENDLERLKKQAQQTNDEFMKLTDKYAGLEAKGHATDKKSD